MSYRQKDPSLPYTAYLVEYVAPDGHTKYDIVMCIKHEIFDVYYDKYGKGLKAITQTAGKINQNMARPQNNKAQKGKK